MKSTDIPFPLAIVRYVWHDLMGPPAQGFTCPSKVMGFSQELQSDTLGIIMCLSWIHYLFSASLIFDVASQYRFSFSAKDAGMKFDYFNCTLQLMCRNSVFHMNELYQMIRNTNAF